MTHDTPLLTTMVAGLGLAFLLGLLAHRLRLPMIAGYLVAGVIIGPFTPGYVADQHLAQELAEMGVILLMFGVGLHFSLADLLAVKAAAVPGAIGQIAVATAAGTGLGMLLGWGLGAALIFGLSLSVASTVVLLRALEERKQVKGEVGRLAMGWLIVEDLVIVVALVMLPLIVIQPGETLSTGALLGSIGWTLVKVVAFVALMLVVGGRVLPWLLVRIAHTRSRELFTLGVLAIALGIAWVAYAVFGASFALGAFVAGLVLNGTPLGHNAAERSLPLRDAFAVLFFVSVGMLFDPSIIVREPLTVLAILGIVIVGKSAAALAITHTFKLDRKTGLTVAASLAQIGEFSFILAAIGVSLGAMRQQTHDLILAAALLSISLNPFVFKLIDRMGAAPKPPAANAVEPPNPATA